MSSQSKFAEGRFQVRNVPPTTEQVKAMFLERFRKIDPERAERIAGSVMIVGGGYDPIYSVSSPKDTGDRQPEYEAAIEAVFDQIRSEFPNLEVKRI